MSKESLPQAAASAPLISIGMPTFNREWSLGRVLQSVLQLQYDKSRIRICFVDNESTDGTIRIIEQFIADHGDKYEGVLLEVQDSNISKARNVAFQLAKGTDYIFFLDSDILVPPDTLNRLLAPFGRDPDVGMVSLPWDTRNAKKRAGLLFRAFDSPIGPHLAYKVGNGCNLVSMRAASSVGFFDERLRVHEDGEFCYRMRKKGFKIVCDSSSEGTHLREIKVDSTFYWKFMNDSAETYRVMLADGSPLHFAKLASSLVLIASVLILLLLRTPAAAIFFLGILAFAAWLNSDKVALDDGSHVRPAYRPIVGLLFTAATVIISVLVLLKPRAPR